MTTREPDRPFERPDAPWAAVHEPPLPRVERIRLRLMEVALELEGEIRQLETKAEDATAEVAGARTRREQLRRLTELEPAVLERVIAMLWLEGIDA